MNANESRVMAAVVDALKKCRDDFAGLPHSLGYEFTHLPMIDDALAQVAALQREGDDGKSAEGAQSELPEVIPVSPAQFVEPIARDEAYDRTYIPLPGGWEVLEGSMVMEIAGGKHSVVFASKYLEMVRRCDTLQADNAKLREQKQLHAGDVTSLSCELDDWKDRAQEAEAEADKLRAEVEGLRKALKAASKQFRHYEFLHQQKHTEGAVVKSQTNAAFADLCDAAIASAGEDHE